MDDLEKFLGCKVSRKLTPNDFRQIRESFGKTQKEWAEFLGLPVTTIQNWELDVATPSRPTHVLLQLMADKAKRNRRQRQSETA